VIRLSLDLPLDGFPLSVSLILEGRAIALMGPSGAGKTSLLEAIAGLRGSARGHLTVNGETWLDGAKAVPVERRRVGYVPQDALLLPHLSVAQNVRFGVGVDEPAAAQAMERLEVAHLAQRMPYSLSGGERMRVALARALAIKPRLLLLDEPLGAVDGELRARIRPYLGAVREALGGPMIFVTHTAEDALALADTVVLLERGRVQAVGPPGSTLGGRAAGSVGPPDA
jgi:molybdate transport system ATP-binding protein